MHNIYLITLPAGAYFAVKRQDNSIVFGCKHIFFINDDGKLETFEQYLLEPALIFIPPFSNTINLTDTVLATEYIGEQFQTIGQITVYTFAHPMLLENVGEGYYAETIASGVPVPGFAGTAPEPFLSVRFEIILENPAIVRRSVVVLRLKYTDYKNILSRARTVIAALASHADNYMNPNPSLLTINALITVLSNLIDEVNNGNHSKIGQRDDVAANLYRLLQLELFYVNKTANGMRGLLQLSGFELALEPHSKPVPAQVIIKKVKKGLEKGTAKINIHPLGLYNLRYFVEISLTPGIENSWVKTLEITNSRKLFLKNLVYGQIIYIRIKAANTKGTGLYSVPVRFISTTK